MLVALGYPARAPLERSLGAFNDFHLSFIIFQIEWFMQQKEKSYQLFSPRFNDLLFEEQWYLVSYSLFCLFSTLVKKMRYFIDLLVYVIGLQVHAVQFGNNWMKKIPRATKIGLGLWPRLIWLSEEFFEFNYSQIGQECSPLINYIAG